MSLAESTFNDPRHRRSEELAFLAERAARRGDIIFALDKYAESGRLELEIALNLGVDGTDVFSAKLRTIFAISAVTLLSRGHVWGEAIAASHLLLSRADLLLEEGTHELESLLDTALRSRELYDHLGADAEAQALEVRMMGGEVRRGLAPTRAVQAREQIVESALIRVADWLGNQPFRTSGKSGFAGNILIYEMPARAASYGIRLFVCSKGNLEDARRVSPAQAVDGFLELGRLAASDPEHITDRVGDNAYSRLFLQAFHDIAPDGDSVGAVRLSTPALGASNATAHFLPVHRQRIRALLAQGHRSERPVYGVLRAIRLSGHRGISIEDDNGTTHTYSLAPGEHDDTIGVKLNRRVAVTARRARRSNGTYHYVAHEILLSNDGPDPSQEAAD